MHATDIEAVITMEKNLQAAGDRSMVFPSIPLLKNETNLIPMSFCVTSRKNMTSPTSGANFAFPEFTQLTNKRLILFSERNRIIWKNEVEKGDRAFTDNGFYNHVFKQANFSPTIKNGDQYPNVTFKMSAWGEVTIYHPEAKKIYDFFA